MDILIYPHAFFDDVKRIMCGRTGGRCGHVKMCRLNMKWHLTDQAEKCPLRENKNND